MATSIDIIHDKWLSDIIKYEVFRLSVNGKSNAGSETDLQIISQYLTIKPVFIYIKLPTYEIDLVHYFERIGFRLVDTNIIFEKTIEKNKNIKSEFTIRFANSRDQAQVQNIARNSFIYSRFHSDSNIPKITADTIKEEWVHNYFLGKRGDEMVVALVDDMVVGFLLLLRGNNGDLTIDLIAVDKKQRRKGIAGDMIAYAESHCGVCSRILVGTQVANVSSIRLYEKIGFMISESNYVLHYHNLPEDEEGR